MRWLRAEGYAVDKVEHRNPFGRVTVDCFGFADILALHKDFPGVLAVQATTTDHVRDRIEKVQANTNAVLWLACQNRIYVVGWALRGARDTRKLWTRQVWSIYSNLEPVMIEAGARGGEG